MGKFLSIVFILFLFASSNCIGQFISGRLTDFESNEPIGYALIFEKGTNNGLQADSSGQFRIELTDQKGDIQISYVGYYSILIKNIPDIDSLYFDLSLFRNYGRGIHVHGGTDIEADTVKQKNIDQTIRTYILNIQQLDEELSTVLNDEQIVFDFDHND